MLNSFIVVSQQVIVLFILIFVGFICTKKKIFTADGVKSITSFLLYIVTPCMIIESFNRPFEPSMLHNMGVAFVAAFAIHAGSIFLVALLMHDKNKSRQVVLQFAVIFSNCGYMALPLQQAVLGSDGVFYGAVFIAVFNMVTWTYGIYLMGKPNVTISIKKLLLNPGVLAVLAGMILFFTPLSLPQLIMQPISKIAVMNTPLPMIVVGYFLATSTTTRGTVFSDRKLLFSIFLRLVAVPLLSLAGLYLAGARGIVLPVMIIAASAPVGTYTAMFAQLYNRDTNLAAKLISLSTLLSIATIPPIVSLAMYLSGL